MENRYEGDEVLRLFSENAINRNNYIARMIATAAKGLDSKARVLEFGAGKGEFIDRLKGKFHTMAVERDDAYINVLSQRHEVYKSIEKVPGEVDYIFLIDVLEHLEDDVAYLKTFFDKLRPGGRLFLFVPAGKSLYADFDRSIGHFRRYRRKELINKVKAAGFKVESCRYHELPGYFATFLHNLVIKKTKPSAGSLRFYDRFLPLTNRFENVIRPPFGKSISLLASRPA